MRRLAASIFALATGLAAAGAVAQPASPTLQAVRQRGVLNCGVSGASPGFSMPDSQGVFRGIDADECRTIAAATLGDASRVKFVPLNVQQRFTALQSGEVDVLFANATWTSSRESKLGLRFASIYYFDGLSFMVRKDLGVASAKQLDGASVCMLPGSTTEIASQEFFGQNNVKFTPVIIADGEELRNTFLAGRCDVYFNDLSAVAGFRASQGARAADFVILPEVLDKEPLGAAVRKGDERWFDIVRWTHFALVTAEEDGVASGNVDSFAATQNPPIRRLLGLEGDFGTAMGLDAHFVATVVKQVGNFGEIWERDVTPTGVPRGPNRLWTKGGLQYAPPIR